MTTNQTTLTTAENMTEVANVILNVLVDYASKDYPRLPSEAQCVKLLGEFKASTISPELAVMAEIAERMPLARRQRIVAGIIYDMKG